MEEYLLELVARGGPDVPRIDELAAEDLGTPRGTASIARAALSNLRSKRPDVIRTDLQRELAEADLLVQVRLRHMNRRLGRASMVAFTRGCPGPRRMGRPPIQREGRRVMMPDYGRESGDPTRLAELLDQLRTWLDLPDTAPIIATLAVAATVPLDSEEAAWLLNVAAPSSGKTEAVNLLDGVADGRLNEITAAGLLGWSNAKQPRPAGVLTRVPPNALVTLGDLSSLLATSDRGGRDQVFGMLRRVYDGHVTRDVAPSRGGHTGEQLRWSGRLTVVGAVTGAIDRYTAHNDALGPRWMYVRAVERELKSRRIAAEVAERKYVREARAEAREIATRIITDARRVVRQTRVPVPVAVEIRDAVLVTCYGRAAVPRNGYGRREIEDVPEIEEPMRLIKQTHVLARGLYALGLDDQAVARTVRRVAMDSMPAARLAVLRALVQQDGQTTAEIARAADLHRFVAHRHCEDFTAIRVADDLAADHDNDHRWILRGEEGELIKKVVRQT